VFDNQSGCIERSTIMARTLVGSLPAMELIHTCYRIGEIDRSVAFYEALGFEERRRMPIRDEAINVFMGLPGDGDRLELTYNHGVDSYDLGTGYNHIALAVEDLDGTLEKLAGDGIEPAKPPYRPGGRTEGSFICFVRDPDGYRVELIGQS
jgi:lactoylglutathione lyase